MQLARTDRTDTKRSSCRPGRVILLFTRAPRDEARAKGLPAGAASRLFAEFIRGWGERASEADAELVAVVPKESMRSLRLLLPDARVLCQKGDSFGAQLESAFQTAFSLDAKAAIIVPGDGPPPGLQALDDAFQHLESDQHAMVLSPSRDGGVNLLGFSPAADRGLAGVRWCEAGVCAALRSHAARSGLPLFVAPSSADVDHISDVRALFYRSCSDPAWRPFRYLLAGLLRPEPQPAPEAPAELPARFFRTFQERAPPLPSL